MVFPFDEFRLMPIFVFFSLNLFSFDIGYIFRYIIALYTHRKKQNRRKKQSIWSTPFLLFLFPFYSFLFFQLWLNPSNDISFLNLHSSCRSPLHLYTFPSFGWKITCTVICKQQQQVYIMFVYYVHGEQQSLNVIPKCHDLWLFQQKGYQHIIG